MPFFNSRKLARYTDHKLHNKKFKSERQELQLMKTHGDQQVHSLFFHLYFYKLKYIAADQYTVSNYRERSGGKSIRLVNESLMLHFMVIMKVIRHK